MEANESRHFNNRTRLSREEAEASLAVSLPDRIRHLVSNGDGTYSIVGHIVFEICDYCVEESSGIAEHVAKRDIYEHLG